MISKEKKLYKIKEKISKDQYIDHGYTKIKSVYNSSGESISSTLEIKVGLRHLDHTKDSTGHTIGGVIDYDEVKHSIDKQSINGAFEIFIKDFKEKYLGKTLDVIMTTSGLSEYDGKMKDVKITNKK